MSAFDDWIAVVIENHEKQLGYPPEYTETEMYFMRDSFNAGMERAAERNDYFAKMMESGAGETEPGERLRQAAREIRMEISND